MKIDYRVLCIFIFLLFSCVSYCCTGITINSPTGGTINGRTVEYGASNLNSSVIISPRGQVHQSLTPDGKNNGLKWTAKYGYVGITMMNDLFIGEGMNEEGLNAGIFYFPKYGSLEIFSKADAKKSLTDMQFVSWLLSNFKSVDEVKKNIDKIKIVNISFENNGEPLSTGHWRVTDKVGNNIVIEIVNNGEIKIFDNKVGILTNSPDFDWQMKNLNNYVNLHSGGVNGYQYNGEKFNSFGVGSGMFGLPGDITPPSRFVRAFFYVSNLKNIKNNDDAISSAFHILNNFDIPIGLEYGESDKEHMPTNVLSATQWTTVCDLKNKNFYFKTMEDSQIKMIDLNKIDFSKIKYSSKPLENNFRKSIKEWD